MVCMSMALCVSCKKDNAEPSGGGTGGGGNTGGGVTGDHEYVDLGLPSGTLWATCNVGADSPEDYGDYFAWGETTTKSTYNGSTYKWGNGEWGDLVLTKYNTESAYGTVDNKTVLDPDDDAAHVNWGGGWRMPTMAEWLELYDNTYSDWTTVGNIAGRKFISLKEPDKFIFLPAAGYRSGSSLLDAGSFGVYWSGSLNSSNPSNAYYMGFDSGGVGPQGSINRYFGYTVRPVRPAR